MMRLILSKATQLALFGAAAPMPGQVRTHVRKVEAGKLVTVHQHATGKPVPHRPAEQSSLFGPLSKPAVASPHTPTPSSVPSEPTSSAAPRAPTTAPAPVAPGAVKVRSVYTAQHYEKVRHQLEINHQPSRDRDVAREVAKFRAVNVLNYIPTTEEIDAEEAAIKRARETAPKTRWYVRCPGCLTVSAVETEQKPKDHVCAMCDTKLEVMGKVHKTSPTSMGHLVTDTDYRSVCDARCTGAPGPCCDCQCGGENHGSGRVVAVDRTEKIPKVSVKSPEKARAQLAEWNAAKAALLDKLPYKWQYDARAKGEWLSSADFERHNQHVLWRRDIAAAGRLKTHHGRLKSLKAIEERVNDHLERIKKTRSSGGYY